jgi:hypothetical protein
MRATKKLGTRLDSKQLKIDSKSTLNSSNRPKVLKNNSKSTKLLKKQLKNTSKNAQS